MLSEEYKNKLQNLLINGNLDSYFKLVEKALNQKRKKEQKNSPTYVYYEAHHILPKCLFPEFIANKDNIVLFTAREHFLAHKMLFNAIPCQELGYALWKMACCNRDIASITLEEYEEARIAYQNLPKWNTGKSTPIETKTKISNSLKEYYKNNQYIMTEEHHKKSVQTRKENGGYQRTESQKQQTSNTLKGRIFVNNKIINKRIYLEELETYLANGWLRGKKPLSEQHKLNIGLKSLGREAWNKGKPGTFLGKHHTEETKEKMRKKKIK